MSTIGFDDLFNKSDFNSGLEALKNAIAAITKEIESTKTAADSFSKTMGEELKSKINQLASTSANFDNELKKVRADFEAFKQSVGQTNSTLDQYKKTNEDLTTKVKNLEEQTKKYTEAQKGASKAASDGGVTMKGLSQQLLGVASGAALVYRGVQMLKEQLVAAVKSTIEFEQAMKEVQAISRASAGQLESLTANANKLGASTEKTAVQIAGLQKELAKLGFTSTEIIASSQAIVDLSTATGENLAGSATVAAATLRAFGLEAVEMTRIVDVMAGSFVRSGLDLEKFRESMKLVAPIARAVNIDVETTTAALSKLADAGLSGSLAGTALRNLFSSMADPTDKLSEFLGYTVTNSQDLIRAFKDLRDRGVDLAQAVQMVDVRARPAFFTLMNQVDSVEALAKEYGALTGEGQRIAEMMRDTLANDIEIANSAFDALRRNIVEQYTPAMREATQSTTTFIEALRLLSSGEAEGQGGILGFLDGIGEGLKNLDDFGRAIFMFDPLMKLLKLGFGAVGDEAQELSRKLKFKEIMQESANATELFARSVKNVEFQALIDEYRELESETKKSEEQTKRMLEIDKILRISFGDTAVAIDKKTGKYFLNTAAIERSINATRTETKTTIESIKTRIQEIDSLKAANEERILRAKQSNDYVMLLGAEAEKMTTIADLLREKDILVNTLRSDFDLMVDESVNGWSVYIDGAKGAKDALEEIAKAEKKRLDEEKKAKEARDKAEAEAKKRRAEELKEINAKLDLEAAKRESELAEVEAIKRIAESENDRTTALRLSNDVYLKKIGLLDISLQKELENIRLSEDSTKVKLAKEQIAYEKHYQALLDLNSNYIAALNKNEEKLFATMQKSIDAEFKANNKMLSENKKLTDDQRAQEEKDAKDQGKLDREKAMLYAQSIQAARRAFDTFFEYRKAKRDEELDAVSRWEEERIKLAGDNQEAIAAIREEAELRRKEIMRKQSRDEKAAAMFNIALNTAQAIVAALKLGPAGLILSVAIGAIGAAQLALVASKKTPEFAKGTTNAPEGQAIVGEKGREIVWDKRSNTTYVTPDAPTLTYLSKGSVVIPNDQTERILSTKVDRNEIAYDKSTISNNRKKEGADLYKLGGMFKEAVREIPLHQTTFDADGVREFVKRGNNRTERLNRRYKY
jgi:TP901 family phage tail tape measure protein